jgi:hypothetical protein
VLDFVFDLTKIRAHICLVLAVLVITPPSIMLFDRREPVTIISGTLEPNTIRSGDPVIVTWTIKENRSCSGDLRRVVVDSVGKVHEFIIEPTIYHEVLTSPRTFVKRFNMPYGMAPGAATYYGVGTRWCNVLQQFIWPMPFKSPGISFTVLPSINKTNGPTP